MRRFPIIRTQAAGQAAVRLTQQPSGPQHIGALVAPLQVRLVGGPHHNRFMTIPRSLQTLRLTRIETDDDDNMTPRPRRAVDVYYRCTFYTLSGTAFEQFVHYSLLMPCGEPLPECNSEGEFPLLGMKLPASQKLIRKEPYGSSTVHASASRQR